ncbi:alpha/beta hydrolase [Mucilaginibacter sp.]|uniref:alpha/beta hydrolase n=1 Tax=Mucilaginibacter sp. TaxID=1882438 RepID=UPI0035BC5A6B
MTYSLRCLLFLLISLQVQSQHKDFYRYPPSEIVTIHSNILKEERTVYIHCPKIDSSNVDKRFPVLYVMDGENHFELLAQYADYLSRPDVLAIPKIIVVGISNTNRRRDLTPTQSILDYAGKPDSSNITQESGKNEAFLQFIRTELMPAIEGSYRTATYKVFAGHSFGGLSSINCMLTHPAMFDAYIAVSPSFYWDNKYLLKRTDQMLTKGAVLNKKCFYSDGNEGGSSSFFHLDLLKFDSLLANKKLVGFNYMYKHYPTETHMTEPIVAYLDALRFIFEDWERH